MQKLQINDTEQEPEEEEMRKWLNIDELDIIADITMDDLKEMNIHKLGQKN